MGSRRFALLLDAAAVFTGAFLLFQIQPVYSKHILPWFGGAPLVWATALVFFQSVLLGGYAYAHLLVSRLSPGRQFGLHAGLLVLSLLFLPVMPAEHWKPSGGATPTWQILAMMAATVGLPYFLLSSTSPLIQAWLARFRGVVPYRLFSVSNLASILGLLSYPFFIEPTLGLQQQFRFWSAGYLSFVVLLCMLMLLHWFGKGASGAAAAMAPPTMEPGPDAEPSLAEKPATLRTRLLWIGLAACPSILFLATTNQLTQDVAPVPFLWILPLVIYLLTFVVSFEFARFVPLTLLRFASIPFLAILSMAVVLPVLSDSYIPEIIVYCLGLLVISLYCHAELYARRPHPRHLTGFYLLVSFGGALGGVFVGLIAPFLFTGYWEIYGGLGLCGLLIFAVEYQRTVQGNSGVFEVTPRNALPLGAAALALAVPFASANRHEILADRNFFGAVRVVEVGESVDGDGDHFRQLNHGSTKHGTQFVEPSRRCEAASYYGQESGVARVLHAVESRPTLRVGIIGLGVGTLATFSRPADKYVFYEIDPLIEDIARNQFWYLSDCSSGVEVRIGDARVVMEAEAPAAYDVFVLDAFSGDSIPTHLLTAEAFRLYGRHLAPSGIIAANISNRYLNLLPVLKGSGEAAGLHVRFIHSEENRLQGTFNAIWAVLSRDADLLRHPALQNGIVRTAQPSRTVTWTDDFSNLFEVLE